MSFLASSMPYLLIGLSIILIGLILLQQKGSGLSATFGGEGSTYSTKRGLEKVLFRATIVVGALFLILTLLNLIVHR